MKTARIYSKSDPEPETTHTHKTPPRTTTTTCLTLLHGNTAPTCPTPPSENQDKAAPSDVVMKLLMRLKGAREFAKFLAIGGMQNPSIMINEREKIPFSGCT